MNIGWMRFIDYWVGRPICLALSLYQAVRLRLPKLGANGSSPDKVLFIKLFGIGSIILSYPAVKAFKERYPETEIYYLTFKQNAEILDILGMVKPENIITIGSGSILTILSDSIKALLRVRRERIPVTIDLEFFSRFTAVFSYLTGATRRIGFYNYHTEGLSRGTIVNVPVSYNHTKHTSEVFMHLVGAIGVKEGPLEIPHVKTGYNLHPDIAAYKKLIIFNMSSSELISLRSWPVESFSELATKVLDEYPDAALVFTGTHKERPLVERAIRAIDRPDEARRIFDLAGRTTLRELIGLFDRADALVTIDSGTAHMASLTNVRIIDLFGPETPALYGPLSKNATNVYQKLPCQPCISVFNGKHSHCIDNICMQKITADAVLAIIRLEFGEGRGGLMVASRSGGNVQE